MLHSQRGSIYRTILAGFIALAFCFALVWPQWTKHRNAKQLQEAADLGRALAFAEESYNQANAAYTPQFNRLNLSLPCPMAVQGGTPFLDCPHYTYQLEEGRRIKAAHKQFGVWVEVDIPAGTVICRHEPDDWAGQDLCQRMQ